MNLPKSANFSKFLACIYFLFFLLTSNVSYAQSNPIEEIERMRDVYPTLTDDEQRVDTLNELAYQFLYVDLSEVKLHADSALGLSEMIPYLKGQSDAESMLGAFYQSTNQFGAAIIHYAKCLEIRERIGKPKTIANTIHNIGYLFYRQNELDSALQMYNRALIIYEAEDFPLMVAGTKNSISEVHLQKGEYDKALQFCLEGLEIRGKRKDVAGLANSLLNLGAIYTQMDRYDSALVVFQRALPLFDGNPRGQEKVWMNMGVNETRAGKYLQAIIYFDKALNLSEQSNNFEEQFNIHYNLGGIYIHMGTFQKAQEHLKAAISIAEKIGNYSGQILCLNNLAEIQYDQEDYEESLSYYRRSMNLIHHQPNRLTQTDLYEGIARAYKKLEIYDSASIYFQLNNRVRDTLIQAEKSALELENHIESVRKDLEMIEMKQQFSAIIIGTLLGIIGLLITSFFFWYRANKEKQKTKVMTLEAENSRLTFQNKLDEMEKQNAKVLVEMEKQNAKALVEGLDEERERIAGELHENLGSLLTSLKWNIDSVEKLFEKQKKNDDFEALNILIDETIEEVRHLSRNMTNASLRKFGVEKAIKKFIEPFNEKGIEITLYTHQFDQRLENSVELGLYRIAQEAINNALKHANAKKITIQLNRFERNINLMIQDDGVGFAEEILKEKNGIGLRNMHNRAKHMGGKASIDSSPGAGTTISVDIPLSSN